MRHLGHTAWWLLSLAWRTDRGRLLRACALLSVAYLATPAVALGLRAFTDAVLDGDTTAGVVLGAVIAAALVAELMVSHFSHLYYFEVGELAETRINDELITAANGTPGMAQLDSADFADAVILAREEVQKLRGYLEAVLRLGALLVQLLLTAVVLASLEPWLALLPLGALPPVLMGRRAQAIVDRSRTDAAERLRLARHLLHVTTSPRSAKEVRISGARDALLERHDRAFEAATRRLWRGKVTGAALRGAGQTAFTLSCCGAILLVLRQASRGEASIGDLVLTLTLAVQLNVQVAAGLGMLATVQAAGHMVRRLETLRAWATPPAPPAATPVPAGEPPRPAPSGPALPGPNPPQPAARTRSVPSTLRHGIRLDGVTFVYPGTDRTVLRDVTLDLPAGRTTALVGENGAGKSTLVKLLCGLYEPTSGRILVDGVDLREVPPKEWMAHVGTLFQDFSRLELTLRESVGVGDIDRLGEDGVVLEGLRDAGAETLLRRVPGGLDGALGQGYTDGAELSGGQWQSLALARTLLRRRPLLRVLDEPAAALDALAEQAVFARYAGSASEAGAWGGVTLFVSHRFSTVRMADRIVVLERGGVRETGSHAELMAGRGLYAELFRLQARGYR
ncbi:ABC transporter ATP-binding protein [Streptomyces sp. 4N509B]|uniref:ABC transporter ATP-binding protein n=1 Tax=Streptomyces sp. 4N509B TaxID=3457413 RepID=UPI003FD59473